MVLLAATLQEEVLNTLKVQRPNDARLHEDLALIRKAVPGNENPEDKKIRIDAEQRVQCALHDHGEWIGYQGVTKTAKAHFSSESNLICLGQI